jgi:hypothetical protein
VNKSPSARNPSNYWKSELDEYRSNRNQIGQAGKGFVMSRKNVTKRTRVKIGN